MPNISGMRANILALFFLSDNPLFGLSVCVLRCVGDGGFNKKLIASDAPIDKIAPTIATVIGSKPDGNSTTYNGSVILCNSSICC